MVAELIKKARDIVLILNKKLVERGYNSLPGVMAQDVTSWGELRQVMRELKKPEVHDVYKSIIIDTVDVAAAMCEKYICNQLGIENIGDGGWTNNG